MSIHAPTFKLTTAAARGNVEEIERALAFLTYIEGLPRTAGCAVDRHAHRATELDGLDLQQLTEAATGSLDAAARGKLAILGRRDACVYQTAPGAEPEKVWCGHATAALAHLLAAREDRKVGILELSGPGRLMAQVSYKAAGHTVSQDWRLPTPSYTETSWRDRTVLQVDALNPYAIVLGPLPDCVTPEAARLQLVGSDLGAKLAVVSKEPTGRVNVSFYNAGGAHGAAPMTGLATLAILSGLSSSLTAFVPDRTISYQTKRGPLTALLPDIRFDAGGSVTVSMPTVQVRLSPFLLESRK